MKEFNLEQLKELTDKAIEPYLVSIEQALNSPMNKGLHREPQSALVKQMFVRSLRLISFDFSNEVDKYLYQLNQADMEKKKKEQAKQEKISIATAPTTPNKKKTLKELREERAKKAQSKES